MTALALVTRGFVAPSLTAWQCARAVREDLVKPVSAKVAPTEPCVAARVQVRPPPLAPSISKQLFPTPAQPTVRVKPVVHPAVSAKVSVGQKAAAPPDPAPPTQADPKPTVKVRKNGNGHKRPKLRVKK